jgi:hypothetical protein
MEASMGMPQPSTDPHSMPQVRRELMMLRGAISSVHTKANELIERLSDFQRQEPENDSAKLMEIPTEMPVTSPFAQELRELSNECSNIEQKLARASYRLEL